MLGRTRVAHYGRRCLWAHSEGHIGVAHYGILVGGPLQLRWQPIGRRCLWANLGEVPTKTTYEYMERKSQINQDLYGRKMQNMKETIYLIIMECFKICLPLSIKPVQKNNRTYKHNNSQYNRKL